MSESMSFEETCEMYEQFIKTIISEISNGDIPKLENVEWEYLKKRINVYPPDNAGKKKRGASGLGCRSNVILDHSIVDIMWDYFNSISLKYGFDKIERLHHNEQELGRYDFRSHNNTKDKFSCSIYLLGEWNNPHISFSLFIAPRFRQIDL